MIDMIIIDIIMLVYEKGVKLKQLLFCKICYKFVGLNKINIILEITTNNI